MQIKRKSENNKALVQNAALAIKIKVLTLGSLGDLTCANLTYTKQA